MGHAVPGKLSTTGGFDVAELLLPPGAFVTLGVLK